MFRRHAFQVVGLVEDRHPVCGQIARPRHAQRHVCHVERVVDDQHLRRAHAPPAALVVAALEVRTRFVQAVAALRLHFVPHRLLHRPAQLLSGAVARGQRPLRDQVQILAERGVVEQGALLAPRQVEPPQAHIVAAPEPGDGGELQRQHRLQEGHVLLFELLLQGDGARRHHHRSGAAVAQGVQDGRHQVGERFADAGAGLGHQVLASRQRLFDRRRHRQLLRPFLVVVQPLRHQAVAAEQCTNLVSWCHARARSPRGRRGCCAGGARGRG